MLFTMQEIQAVLGLLNRLPMTPAEQLFTANFFQRLATFCTPPPPEPEDDAQAMADALDAVDKEPE